MISFFHQHKCGIQVYFRITENEYRSKNEAYERNGVAKCVAENIIRREIFFLCSMYEIEKRSKRKEEKRKKRRFCCIASVACRHHTRKKYFFLCSLAHFSSHSPICRCCSFASVTREICFFCRRRSLELISAGNKEFEFKIYTRNHYASIFFLSFCANALISICQWWEYSAHWMLENVGYFHHIIWYFLPSSMSSSSSTFGSSSTAQVCVCVWYRLRVNKLASNATHQWNVHSNSILLWYFHLLPIQSYTTAQFVWQKEKKTGKIKWFSFHCTFPLRIVRRLWFSFPPINYKMIDLFCFATHVRPLVLSNTHTHTPGRSICNWDNYNFRLC